MTQAVAAYSEPKNPYELAALARDVTIHGDGGDILAKHGLNQQTYQTLKTNDPSFPQILEQLQKEWLSIRNTHDRVTTLTLLTFEQLLPKLYAIAADTTTPANHVTEIAKVLAKAGGVGEQKREVAQGEKFTIHIDLGPDKSVTIESAKEEAPLELEATETVTIPPPDRKSVPDPTPDLT